MKDFGLGQKWLVGFNVDDDDDDDDDDDELFLWYG